MTVDFGAKIFVAGSSGLVGSAVVRGFLAAGYDNVLQTRSSELDLRNQTAVQSWFLRERPDFVYLVAGHVGGIMANSMRPADFLYDNLLIHANVLEASRQNDVQKLLYLGSSCIYPRLAPQPISEDSLLTSELEPTNEAYALAKISGIKLCDAYRVQHGCDFISAMPTNLYGPNDNFDLVNSHVLPALMRKFHEAKLAGASEVEVWGSGAAMREFLHVDDLADACVFLMDTYSESGHINVGTGNDLTIRELAETIGEVVHPSASLVFDRSKPDGMPRKVLDVTRMRDLGWQSTISLRQGIESTYAWFVDNVIDLRGIQEKVG